MYSSSKTKNQLLHETEELSTKLDIAQQHLLKSSERQMALEERLQEHLKSETLLIAMSARFVSLPAEGIDSEIENAQRIICETFHFGRCSLWQIIEGKPGSLLLTHLHQIQGSPTPPDRMIVSDYFPWSSSKILDGETVIISKMTDLPQEADRDRESYHKYGGTKSVVLFPLTVGNGPVFGLLGFADFHTERNWQETEIKRLMLIAQVFSSALARKYAENSLRESKMKLDMATNAAGAGLWILNPGTGYVWFTPKTRELFNIAQDEPLNYESLLKLVHPEDYVRFRQTVQQALQSGAPLRCEVRILLPDGNSRWLIAIGQRHFRPSEASYHLMGVSLNITERKRSELSLVESFQFEKLLTEISARFINQQAERIDSEIQSALISISEFLHLDLSALWQRSGEAPDLYKLSHIYSALDGPQLLDRINQDHFPWVRQQMLANRTVIFSSINDLPAEAERDRESCILFNIKSNLTIPLFVEGKPPFGILGFNATRVERDWPETLIKQLELVAQIFTNALARKQADIERKQMELQVLGYLRQIEALKQRLESENIYLKDEVKHLLEHTKIVGQSAAMEKVLAEAKQVAGTDTTVLLLGETGTGKELLARAIHRMSLRKDRALIKVNCAALPPTLIESELFGREKGAYTGAMTRMTGRFELADKSTLFLDEIGELPLDLQSKLLRVLEEGEFERLGSTKTQHGDVRIIAATNRNLEQEIIDGKFRQDLFYRLNVFPIVIPPLRERPEDIPLLVRSIVKEFQKRLGKEIENIPKKTMQVLQSYLWPGNVRELRNIIEHAMILCKGETLNVNLPASMTFETVTTGRLENIERGHIIEVLNQTGWRISGSGGAAEILGLKRTTLNSKLKKLNIRCSKSSQAK